MMSLSGVEIAPQVYGAGSLINQPTQCAQWVKIHFNFMQNFSKRTVEEDIVQNL